jgi:ubiquinone/menaquinone biosynthesis C-methylase UbiE
VARRPGRPRQLELSPEYDIRHPLFARMYVRFVGRSADRDQNRVHLLEDLSGRVLELGCGSGMNFPRYPPTVTELIAVEPEPYMREHAEQAAKSAPVPVRVLAGDADHLPLGDESVDAAVCSLVLCSVPDQASALQELKRVLRPGGHLHFYEHVAAYNRAGHALQRAADATFWPRVFGNCHTARDTATAIEGAGFRIERCDRLVFPKVEFPHPHILGRAQRRPG